MKTVIFDLDGTLADLNHRRPLVTNGNRQWDKFHAMCSFDAPKTAIIELYLSLYDRGHRMHIVSGRSDSVREETVIWLKESGIPYHKLTMRPHGHNVPDVELKRTWLYDGTIVDKKDILFCVDDRQRVVDMWRAEGLICIQVDAWEETK